MKTICLYISGRR